MSFTLDETERLALLNVAEQVWGWISIYLFIYSDVVIEINSMNC